MQALPRRRRDGRGRRPTEDEVAAAAGRPGVGIAAVNGPARSWSPATRPRCAAVAAHFAERGRRPGGCGSATRSTRR